MCQVLLAVQTVMREAVWEAEGQVEKRKVDRKQAGICMHRADLGSLGWTAAAASTWERASGGGKAKMMGASLKGKTFAEEATRNVRRRGKGESTAFRVSSGEVCVRV